jgi:hypothetical protein
MSDANPRIIFAPHADCRCPGSDSGSCSLTKRIRWTDKAQLGLLSKLDCTGRIDGCIFVFTCNDTDRLEARFLSRCLVIEFSSYGMNTEIAEHLANVWHAEGGNGNGPDFARLSKECRDNVRDCLGHLEVELMAL